ncbi:MAG TPA: rhomboid family intramembrane serine protease [Gemmatimonadales bacterium]|nr:rhomboid family intramembrane serine protease [Gemmatimonadales bacterium]
MSPKHSVPVSQLPTAAEAKRALSREFHRDVRILVGIVAVLWGVLLVDAALLSVQLTRFGILPRTAIGLRGLLFAPFLHSGVGHLIGNTIGFLLLGCLVLFREETDFWTVSGVGALAGGMGLWLFGRPAIHVGASGIIFCYFGYLISTGYFERRIGSILLSLGAVGLWGGFIFGILPGQPGVSWEGHLFGLLSGVLAAWLLARFGRRRRGAA